VTPGPARIIRPARDAPAVLREDFARIRAEFELPERFPDEVTAEAERAAAAEWPRAGRLDLREQAFMTIDPPGSMDLDQAMLLERDGDGYVVHYAIADVGAILPSGGAVEREAWARGQTVYLPDMRVGLYPPAISEGAASLLPDQERPALVYRIHLDGEGRQRSARVDRAVVRSHRRLAYGEGEIPLLQEIGERRMALARERGAVSLDAPAQEVVPDPAEPYGYRLELEQRRPDEDWNAEISLLAGMAAAGIMGERGFGLLRTMGGADAYRVGRLRSAARALGVSWPDDETFEHFAMRLDPAVPREAALIEEARAAMGHAGYRYFEGALPPDAVHAGIASHYAHTTAPLRRLADRYVLELVAGGGDREALQKLPDVMAEAGGRSARVESAVVDDMEARLLEGRVGETFAAVAMENDRRGTVIRIADPPVRARMHADPPPTPGDAVQAQLVRADPISRSLEFRTPA
jgi:exoribonuclease R